MLWLHPQNPPVKKNPVIRPISKQLCPVIPAKQRFIITSGCGSEFIQSRAIRLLMGSPIPA